MKTYILYILITISPTESIEKPIAIDLTGQECIEMMQTAWQPDLQSIEFYCYTE